MKKTLLYLLLMLVAAPWAIAQQKTISGIITDPQGEPIPGATVIAKGFPNVGVISDFDGNFLLDLPSVADTITVSFVGMLPKTFAVGKQTRFALVLEPENINLQEVVVVAYGRQLKSDIIGSVSKIKAQDIANVPSPTFEGALQGKSAGVFIGSSSGKLGEAISVRIRGSSSISAGNQPLYVVDGMIITSQSQSTSGSFAPSNPLADINPADISAVSVLKDASATAIYGARAANGVVLITTKRGKEGKTRIDANYRFGISRPTHLIDMMSGPQYEQYITQVYAEPYAYDIGVYFNGDTGAFFNSLIPGFGQGHNTNWQKEAFQTGLLQQADVAMYGGTEKTRFYAGLSYNDQKGIMIGNALTRYGARLNLDHKANDFVEVGMSSALSATQASRLADDASFMNPLQMVAMPPVHPVNDTAEVDGLNRNTIYENPLLPYTYNNFSTNTYRALGKAYLKLKITNGLSFKAEAGVDLLSQQEKNYFSAKTQDGAPRGISEKRTVQVVNLNTNAYLTYHKLFANVHHVELIAGSSSQRSTNNELEAVGRNYPTDNMRTLSSAAQINDVNAPETEFTYLSYFVRGNYKLNNRYILNLSMRADGSSRFGPSRRFGFFPMAAFGWLLSNESFLAGQTLISFLKLKASYGLTGNSEIGNFAWRALSSSVNNAGTAGLSPLSLRSNRLSWESTADMNLGIDFGLWNNRLSGEFNYYRKNTTQMLISQNLALASGYASLPKNLGKMQNSGLELVLNTVNLDGEFKWSTNLNMGINKNKVTDFGGEYLQQGVNRVEAGHAIGDFYMLRYAGTASADGVVGGNPNGTDIKAYTPLYYVGDGTNAVTSDPNQAQMAFVGTPHPKLTGGINNTFAYKRVELNVFFNFVQGNHIYRLTNTALANNGFHFDNQLAAMAAATDRSGGNVPTAPTSLANATQNSDRYLEDGSYIRLKTITLSYSFNDNALKAMHLEKLRLFVSAQNLLTFTKYTGWDPEVNYSAAGATTSAQNIMLGLDYFTPPQARSFTMGLNLTF